jgi:hypothetical protein
MIFKLDNNIISWSSKLQPTEALPTIKAKYRSLVDGGQEIMWLRRLLREPKCLEDGPTIMFCDN